jgi:hypothetical protein
MKAEIKIPDGWYRLPSNSILKKGDRYLELHEWKWLSVEYWEWISNGVAIPAFVNRDEIVIRQRELNK